MPDAQTSSGSLRLAAASGADPIAGLTLAPTVDPSWLKWAILVSASLGALLEIVDTSIVNVALDEMQASLGATISEIGWVVTIYSIANVVILPMTAWLGDRFGTKRYFIFSLVAFTAASILCGLSNSLGMLIFARLLQGLGGGGLLAKAQAILFKTFPKEQQPMAQAVFGMVVIAGPAIGPVVGGYIVTQLNWRWIFFVNLPLGILATLMCWAFLKPEAPKQEAKDQKVDWLGILWLVVAVGCLQTFLEQGQEDDWFDSNFIRVLAVGAVVGTFLLLQREPTIGNPVVDFRVLRHRSLPRAVSSAWFSEWGCMAHCSPFPSFASRCWATTAQQTGLVLAPSALATILVFPLIGRLSGKIDARLLICIGSAIIIGSMFKLQGLAPQTGVDDLFWPLDLSRHRHRVHVPAHHPRYPRADPTAGGLGRVRVLQPHPPAGRKHRHRLPHDASCKPQRFPSKRTGGEAPVTRSPAWPSTWSDAVGFAAHGFDAATAHRMAERALDGMVSAQAAVMSFGDIFHIVGVAFLLTMPLVLLLGSGRGAKRSAEAH